MPNTSDIKEALDGLEASIAEVKRQYDFFFQGGRRSEPADKRREVEETVRRMGQRKITNTTDQFRFNSLQSKFYALSNLWMRQLRDLEEGRMTRDATGTLVRTAPASKDPVDPAHIERVMDELSSARKACGLPTEEADLSAIRDTLLSRARDLSRSSGGKKVEFKVSVEKGKPKVKAQIG